MDKRTKILLTVLVALVVLAGGYYAYLFMTAEEEMAEVAAPPAVTGETAKAPEAKPAEPSVPETAPAGTPAEPGTEADKAAQAPAAEVPVKTAPAALAEKPAAKPGEEPAAEMKAPCPLVIKADIKGKPAEFKTPEEFVERSGLDEKAMTGFGAKNLDAAKKKLGGLEKAKAPKDQVDCAKKEVEMAEALVNLIAEKFAKKPEKEAYVYSSLDKRDPFMSPDEIPKVYPKVPANAPPMERVPSEQLKLQGVMWNEKGYRALLITPDGRGYTVKVGDSVGNKDGKVVKITEKILYIEERIPDIFGDIEVRSIPLKLHKEAE